MDNSSKLHMFVGLIFVSVCLGVVFLSVNSSLSCVDSKGCLRSWCNYDWFRLEYQITITEQAKLCPFQKQYSLPDFNDYNIKVFVEGIDENLK